MKISVITAVLNGAKTIPATIDSVAKQIHPDVEHIVIDGGSRDKTVEIVKTLSGRVKHLVSEPDNGVYEAFNKGLKLATGDAVIFLNAGDTYASTDALVSLATALQESLADVAFGNLLMTDPAIPSKILRRYAIRDFSPDDLLSGLMPPHPTMMLRREVHERVGFYDPQYQIAGDFELCLRIFLKYKLRFVHVDEFLVNMPAGGLSNRNWMSMLGNTKEMYRACRLNGLPASWMRLGSRLAVKWRMGK